VNDLLNTLFGLRELGFGDPEVTFAFARPFPAWAWLLIVAGAIGLSVWSYRRIEASGAARATLAMLRAGLILLIAIVITGPQLVRPNVRVENDWVIVLADRSASLTVEDVRRPGDERISRDEQLRRTIAAAWPAWEEVSREKRVLWLAFDGSARELPVRRGAEGAIAGLDLGEADGRRTAIGAAIDQALQLVTARPVSAIVVLSDGRSVDETSRRAMRRLRAERIPVYAVGLGSETSLGDLLLADVEAPEAAFVDDEVPVRVRVEHRGAAERDVSAMVRLTDEATGLLLDERPVSVPAGGEEAASAEVTLRVRVSEPGSGRWRVTLVPRRPDIIEENNRRDFAITLVDRPLRVLYLDGYPRWEARYLRNLFLREESLESSSLLLSSRRQYLQEGDIILDRLPLSPEEWEQFDVVILGDLRAELFSAEQLMQLRDHVADRGAGLLWIGGPSATPTSWAGTPLADLLPFRLSAAGSLEPRGREIEAYLDPVLMHRTPAAERLGLLDLDEAEQGWPEVLRDAGNRWARLWFAQRISPARLKPAVEVLATFLPAGDRAAEPTSEGSPAVVSMRYGAGRVVYVATDEIWRWRYGRGETLPERFWIPLLRFQARERLAQSDRSALLEVAPRRPTAGRPAAVRLRLLDQDLLDRLPRRTPLRIEPANPDDTLPTEELVLGPSGSRRERTATWIPPAAGRYRLASQDPLLAGLAVEVDVVLDDNELRRPETDFALLASVAAETGGELLQPAEFASLPERLPRRELTIAGDPDVEPLWDRPVVLVLILTIAGLEWLGRRLLRLA